MVALTVDLDRRHIEIEAGQFVAQRFALCGDKEAMQLLFKRVQVRDGRRCFAALPQKILELIHGVGLTGQERRTLQCLHGASLRAIGCRDTNLVPEWLCPVKTSREGSPPERLNQICSPLALSIRDLHPTPIYK